LCLADGAGDFHAGSFGKGDLSLAGGIAVIGADDHRARCLFVGNPQRDPRRSVEELAAVAHQVVSIGTKHLGDLDDYIVELLDAGFLRRVRGSEGALKLFLLDGSL
jgi:hypothetical protein